MNRKYIAVLLATAVALVITFCRGGSEQYYTTSGVVWNTAYKVTYKARGDLSDSIVAAMNRVDMSASMFNPRSTLSRINDNSTTQADTIVEQLLARSLEINRETGGAFDPTISPLFKLWRGGHLPSQADIDSVMQLVGLPDKVALRDGQVTKSDPRVRLDFNAIAKGYGCDEVARTLARCGAEDYIVEIGGEIVARGVNHNGKPWRVSIDMPIEAAGDSVVHSSAMVMEIGDGAMATSGNYRNFKIVDGQKVAHIIDPRNGRSAMSRLLSVTVIAGCCMDADAYATALMVMGYDAARQLAQQRTDLGIVLIYADGDNQMQTWLSPTAEMKVKP